MNTVRLPAQRQWFRLRTPEGEIKGLGRVPALLCSVAYGWVLAALPLMAFRDRENYLEYASSSLAILARNFSISPLAGMVNEPIWLLLNVAAGTVLEPEQTVRAIIFLSATTVAYLVLRAMPRQWPWLLAFLFVPQILKNHITHLRQGLGVACFLFGWFGASRSRRWIFMGLAPFIHASFFFVLMLEYVNRVLVRLKLAADVRAMAFAAAAITMGVAVGSIAALLGARQASAYAFAADDVSGFAFVFWTLMLALLASEYKTVFKQHSLAVAGTLFYLGTYFFVEVTARVFDSVLILVLLAGLSLSGRRRLLFIFGMLGWAALQWTVRLTREGSAF